MSQAAPIVVSPTTPIGEGVVYAAPEPVGFTRINGLSWQYWHSSSSPSFSIL